VVEEFDMGTIGRRVLVLMVGVIVCSIAAGGTPSPVQTPSLDGQATLNYLKGLKGQWVVQGGEEGQFGWEFDVTSRGSVVVERLKVGTPTEMTTIYYLDGGKLNAAHYCQLKNQPRLTAVATEAEGDLHFICNGHVGNTDSHAELHMHGVHFQKKGDSLVIWMDMMENGEVAFQTSYELVRVNE
jgi:hypothetical protein